MAAQSVPLIQNGRFVGYQSSRETAPRIGRQSGGGMRADGWNRIPLIRMTNVNMLPVPGMSLDEIVADTDDGLYLANNRSWSIDDRRLNFQFATEVAYEIKGGEKGRLFKNCTYTGITYEFWRSCDAVGDERSFVMLGHAELRQGRAVADGAGRACRARRPLPQRPGGGGQVVSDADGPRAPRPRRGSRSRRSRSRRTCWRERCASARRRPRCWSSAGDSALTRFANSEIHQNVAERSVTVNLRHVVGRRIAVVSTGKVDAEGLRSLVHRAAVDRPELRGARGLGRPAGAAVRPEPSSAGRGSAWAAGTAGATPEFRAEGVRAVIAAADAAGVIGLRRVLDGRRGRRRRQLEGRAGGREPHLVAAAHGPHVARRRHRLRRGT